jgi:hypothetical protein
VDSTTEYVYDFIAYGCDPQNNPARNSYINRFAAGTPLKEPLIKSPTRVCCV